MDNYLFRKNAREQLGGRIFAENWLTMLIVVLIVSFLEYCLPGVGILLLAGILNYGVARITVSLARGSGKVRLEDLISPFKEGVENVILLGLLTQIFVALWSLLLVIPGIVKAYAYSMAPFIQQDSEDKGWKSCMDRSTELMRGRKADLFMLDLSFIGWYILGALCLGIGIFFVVPYHLTARANFYESIKDSFISTSSTTVSGEIN